MGRIANGWHLTKQCAGVINKDKELVVFPIVSAVLSMLVCVTFVVPSVLAGAVQPVAAMRRSRGLADSCRCAGECGR